MGYRLKMETDKINKNILEEISIKNFMGFIEANMSFAQPNGNKGSGLTIITGPNNSGKTSILEALQDWLYRDDHLEINNNNTDIRVNNKTSNEFNKYKFNKYNDNLQQGVGILGKDHIINYENKPFCLFISSKRSWETTFNNMQVGDSLDGFFIKGFTEELNIKQNAEKPEYGKAIMIDGVFKGVTTRPRQKYESQNALRVIQTGDLGTALSRLNDSDRATFNSLIKKILPDYQDWSNDKNTYIMNYEKNGISHSLDKCGSGIISIMMICYYLLLNKLDEMFKPNKFKDNNFPIVIDEPELSLSPQAQKNLAKLLAEEAMNIQIIITTHSPYFINWEDFGNGAKLVRTNINDDGSCSIKTLKQYINDDETLKEETEYKKLLCNESWKRPHGFDLVAKEIFFSDKILLVEGQDDVGLLKDWFKTEYNKGESYNPPFEIFGYGAGGVDNIPKLMDFAKDLGIKKVGILTDKLKGDKKNTKDSINKKVTEYKYHFEELETDDIRDKIDIKIDKLKKRVKEKEGFSNLSIEDFKDSVKEVEGYFDDKGIIKKCVTCKGGHTTDKCKDEECKHSSLVEIFNKFDTYFTPS
jgi:predicted ATP-dependent endonuclease of OLD family